MTLNAGQFNEEQLPLFVTAREIHDTYTPVDMLAYRDESREEMWRRKRSELDLDTARRNKHFLSSIRSQGVQQPVWAGVSPTGEKHLWEGHHRIAAQHFADPDRLVPIIYGAHDPARGGAPGPEIDTMLEHYGL